MVCTKCQNLSQKTHPATPTVKRKSDLYHGSPASTSAVRSDKTKPSATLGHNGIGKSKLLSKSAQNPYAAYSSSCSTCKTKTEQGRKFCQRCAYKANACAMCGKGLSKEKATDGAPVVQGQKFSAK
ncbi:MAG: hypothetical protein FRX48_02411 [Lasallia pustulata]|uniref:Cysteine-rich PDZ-binding protein n=1 Tax=Lasallia pustulata TaxID=136370 RepID=A0A5M8PYC3_9LECA|nr:MAG: hypothetical protein FRX48_02411 [Lasallia pustulata]